MCLSYCTIKKILFDNHDDCHPQWCEHAQIGHQPCDTCDHRMGEVCGLTRYPLPKSRGCCHWNVDVINDSQQITLADLRMLGIGVNETVEDVLTGFDIPYEVDDQNRVWLDVGNLALPTTYGRGSD
ncbi:MAG: hypothetical protein AAF629_00275 [Chloroflexota bacterium]